MHRILKFWRQYVASTLIFVLLLSQTIRVDFFTDVQASQDTYRDIVSIFVDELTYAENRVKIMRYAEDIQNYLGSTRTSLFILAPGTTPAQIAAQNEKLYYEGDGEKGIVSQLVGTILIGDVPIAMIDAEGDSFASVYPYVDFVDKKFVYDEKTARYGIASYDNQKIIEPEIWHGVINPAVGRFFEPVSKIADPTLTGSVDIIADTEKIGVFLDKTHDFYTQSGVFSLSVLPPRVFYYDGFIEAKSFAIEDLGAYEVNMANSEEIVYDRFTKYFLKHIIAEVEAAKKKFNKEELEYIDELGIPGMTNNMFPPEQVDKTPDILTKPMALELLKRFHELINTKTLGDIRGFVRNAGRYNDGSSVRIDQPAVNISLMDYAAANTIRKINDKLENWVDTIEIQNPFSTFIMDYLTIKEPYTALGMGVTRHYDNFLFGRKGSTIFDPSLCTIARGSDYTSGPYKQGLLVEANAAFDVYTTPESMKLYEKDGKKQIDCAPDDSNQAGYKTDTYWGKNIITNVNTSNWTFNEPSWTQDFYIPIFSLGGMKEVNQVGAEVQHIGPGIEPANPRFCNIAYAPYPYMLQSGAIREDGPWPNDEGKSIDDISCLTEPDEYSQPTWGGEGNPNTRRLGQEMESHYLVGGPGQCLNGQVAINLVSNGGGGGATPPYAWACLPLIECEMPISGKTHYDCFAPQMELYVKSLVESGGENGPIPVGECDGSIGKLFSSACPYNVGNDQERYWEKIPNGEGYLSPCFAGYFIFNGALAPGLTPSYPCVSIAFSGSGTSNPGNNSNAQNNSNTSSEFTEFTVDSITDFTTYETQSFHSIFNSRVFHKSPTDDELAAALKSNVTPSLPVDHDRSVIFMEESPANKDKEIKYANMFRFDELSILTQHKDRIYVNLLGDRGQERIKKYGSGAILITAYRIELDRLGKEQWEGSLPSTEPKFYPPMPPCWGGLLEDSPCDMTKLPNIDGPLSDEDIAAAIQANRWLNPDVTVKMKKAVETGLSYSRQYGSGGLFELDGLDEALLDVSGVLATITGTLSSPPKIPTLTGAYEVAYLGLTHFIPDGDDESSAEDAGSSFTDGIAAYTQGRQELAAINTSEQDAEDAKSIAGAPSDSCGPPEGVDLFEWPSAIMCWIKASATIRIIGQACGTNTIGLGASLLMSGISPVSGSSIASLPIFNPAPENTATVAALNTTYAGGRLTYHLDRTSILPGESLNTHFFYSRSGSLLATPADSTIEIEVMDIRDKTGNTINIDKKDTYISIAPSSMRMGTQGVQFLIQGKKNIGKVTLRGVLSIPSADGGNMQVTSDIFTLDITDEYLVPLSKVEGVISSQIPVTASTGMVFDFDVRNLSGELLAPRYPIVYDIYDDVSNTIVATGITITQGGYTLPLTYTKNTGVYRLEFDDADGRHASQSIAVVAGPLARISFSPISSALLAGSNTVVTLRLRDALGNPISPDLHSIDLVAEGGYFILASGEKKTTLHIDAIESEIPLTLGSDVSGQITLSATADDTIKTAIDLSVFESARVVLSRTQTPEVGGGAIPISVRVEGADGQPIQGFRSVLQLDISNGGGVFTPQIVTIENGIAQPIIYTPGRRSGIHRVRATIPGIGSVPDIAFSVNPGKSLYISHVEDDTYMTFSLRDRYDNIVPETLPGTLELPGMPAQNIEFSGGLLQVEKTTGYMMVRVPELRNHTLTYSDAAGTYTMRGIPDYIVKVASLSQRFDFTEDYNARYTVLAGGSFLRESEDILYNTTPGSGQSLAVTTLLDTPYKRQSLFSLSPGGGIQLGDTLDALPETSVSIEGGYPLLTVHDTVTNSIITRATYHLDAPLLQTCADEKCLDALTAEASVTLISSASGYTARKGGNTLSFMKDTKEILTVDIDGKISYLPGVILEVNTQKLQKGLVLDIVSGVNTLGTLVYHTDERESILTESYTGSLDTLSTVILDEHLSFAREEFSRGIFADPVYGYRFEKKGEMPIYDDEKNGPEAIDGLGLTYDTPGIGWKGTNRMMLSYAGGDTVGEATKWFHTYTMVNLGDPVAHNDKKAPGTELDGIDRSIGTELTSPQSSPVKSYTQRDMDNDGYEDIVVQYADGYIELLLNLGDRIRSRGKIAYIPDIISRGFSLGDFSHDGYADLLGVDKEGSFVILSNNERKFTRMKLTVPLSETLPLGVAQFKVRDMDNDMRDDIVYLTEGGELSILYGTDTPGLFDKRVLDATLGLTLSNTPIKTGGALYASRIPQVSLDPQTASEGLDESIIWNEIYAQYSDTQKQDTLTAEGTDIEAFADLQAQYGSALASPLSSVSTRVRNFARSEYVGAFGIDISKRYSLGSGSLLRADERVRVTIDIKNTSTQPLQSIEYFDTIPSIFSATDTTKYSVKIGDAAITRDFALTSAADYDAYLTIPDIPAGQTATVTYEVTALPTSYGELLVGDYEKGETGADTYGDVGFSTATTCGADMILWRSEPTPRDYIKGTRSFASVKLSETLEQSLADLDTDGVPDSIQNLSQEDKQDILDTIRDTPGVSASKPSTGGSSATVEIGYDEASVAEIEATAQEIYDELGGCGGGAGNACMSFPINWAPLAPGNDPVVLGYPIGDGLRVDEGVPLLSGLTRFDWGFSPYCVTTPMIWPISPLAMEAPLPCSSTNVATAFGEATTAIANGFARVAQGAAQGASNLSVGALLNGADSIAQTAAGGAMSNIGAGGYIGIDSASNQLRIFATPTLTLGLGVAICLGGPARTGGNIPPAGLWPLAQAGNCLVVTKPLNMCSNDGTIADVDIRDAVGLGTMADTFNAGNGSNAPGAGGACTIVAKTSEQVESVSLTQDLVAYARAPDTAQLPSLYSRISKNPPRLSRNNGPLLSMRGASPDGALASVSVDIDLAKPLTFDNIVDIDNARISGFPDFIMDWVSRQTDEFVNGLFTVPNFTIIPPTTIGQNMQFDGTMSGLTSSFKSASEQVSLDNLSRKTGEAYDLEMTNSSASTNLQNRTQSSNNNATSDLGQWMQSQQNSFDATQDSAFAGELGNLANQGKGGISAIRAAYKLIGKLPLIRISEKTVPVDVPWILPQELDKYARSLDAYAKELNYALENFCVNNPTPECANQKARINVGPLLASINQNLKRVEEYKNFPIKLQKYITWKQRYLSQILCYITEVQQMTTGWFKDNSIRFKKWAELVVLIRAIAESWQPLLDIISKKDATCSVCHNERYNAKYWKYKIISLLIPSIPVVKMPRWPDVVLDLSDVRLGIVLAIPNFQFNLKPIRLPDIPDVSLPSGPNVNILGLDLLPPIPELPDLPDLPAIPVIKLPNLPPPPKLPKILSEFKTIIKILKLYKLIECYLNKTPFVPEWTVGDVIAQRTERQGTMGLDFIDVTLPQISFSAIKEIRVSSHIDFELRSDFVTEFARAAVEPINQFGADLGRGMPTKVGEGVNISTPSNIDINLQGSVVPDIRNFVTDYIDGLERDKDIMYTTDEFATALIAELSSTDELSGNVGRIRDELRRSALDVANEEKELLAYNETKYDILTQYIQTQYDETAYMQNIIDLLTTDTPLLASTDITRAQMVADTNRTRSTELAREWNTRNSLSLISTPTSSVADSYSTEANALIKRVGRMAALSADTTVSGTESTLTSGYTPNLSGIYIVTSRGTQTRLFDYTESLQKTDDSTKIDIDKDGDMDYLFVMDGALFLKRTTLADPVKNIDTKITLSDLDAQSSRPTAPDFFGEYVSLPNNLTVQYISPQKEDSIWRMSFYDRYLEWDKVASDEHDPDTSPEHIIDFVRASTEGYIAEKPALRTLQSVEDPQSVIIEGPRMEVLTGPMEFILSPGRRLYTGDRDIKILYSTGTAVPSIEKTLQPHTGYAFSDLTNIQFNKGILYIIYPSLITERYDFTDSLLDMPILPGMKISAGQGEVTLYHTDTDSETTLLPGSLYQIEAVSELADEYSTQVLYNNGFYHARIENTDILSATPTGVSLLTPQASSDSSDPDVDMRDGIRVPVYQTRDFLLRDFITETNAYTVLVDTDTTQDTDGDGIYDNDLMSTGPGLSITDTSMTFGPYDTVGRRNMLMQVKDEYYNTTIVSMVVDVYAPIPAITQSTGALSVLGSLPEPLIGQPIHLFRVRTGTDILPLGSDSIVTQSGGVFSSVFAPSASGVLVSGSGYSLSLTEQGVAQSSVSPLTRVTLANDKNPLSVDFLDSLGRPVYRQVFSLPETLTILATESENAVEALSGNTLALSPRSGYRAVSARFDDPSIPGGYYIVDTNQKPIVAIARDGNIYSIATDVSAVFSEVSGYPRITLRMGDSDIVSVLYKFDFFYTLK